MALNYQDASQPLQGGVVYNPNPGWWATLLSGIKDAGSAIGQGALDAAPYLLNSVGNSNTQPMSVLPNNPYNPSDISTPNNPNNFKIQNANPYSSPLQQAYANLQTASSTKPQLAYSTLSNASVKQSFNGLVGVQIPAGEFGPDGLISQNNGNFGQNSLLAQAPPVPGPGTVQQWSDAVPSMRMSSPGQFSSHPPTPHNAGYPQHTVAISVSQIAQGDRWSEPYGYPRRGKQGESGATYQMLQGTLPSGLQQQAYLRKAKMMDLLAKTKEYARTQKLKAYYGKHIPKKGDFMDWRNWVSEDNKQWHQEWAAAIKREHANPMLAGVWAGITNQNYLDPKPLTKQEANQRLIGEQIGSVIKSFLDPDDGIFK